MPLQFTRRQLLAHSAALPLWPILSLAGLGLTACSSVETTSVQARLLGKSITVISTIGTTLRLSWRVRHFTGGALTRDTSAVIGAPAPLRSSLKFISSDRPVPSVFVAGASRSLNRQSRRVQGGSPAPQYP
jgi:hypothetical protein